MGSSVEQSCFCVTLSFLKDTEEDNELQVSKQGQHQELTLKVNREKEDITLTVEDGKHGSRLSYAGFDICNIHNIFVNIYKKHIPLGFFFPLLGIIIKQYSTYVNVHIMINMLSELQIILS